MTVKLLPPNLLDRLQTCVNIVQLIFNDLQYNKPQFSEKTRE